MEGKWLAMKKIWLEAAAEVCGWTQGKGRHKETWWWNEEVARAVEEKNAKFAIWNQTRRIEDQEIYKLAKRNSCRVIWEAQESKRRELMEEIVEGSQQTLFKIVKQMAQSAVDVMGPTCVKDEAGNIVTEDTSRTSFSYLRPRGTYS